MPIENKEATKKITHPDIRRKVKSIALPGKKMCKSGDAWELAILCPANADTNKPELIGDFGGRNNIHIGTHGGNIESMYRYPEKGEKVGRCMVTGKPCDHIYHGKRAPGRCDSCCYAG